MAGFRIYSFDWETFTDLTTNSKSTIHAALAKALEDPKTRKKLSVPSKAPKTSDKMEAYIRELFLNPEWYSDQPSAEVSLRQHLLFGMFQETSLKSIGLVTTPAWRKFHDCCSFDLGRCLAGKWTLNLERMKGGKSVYYKMEGDQEPNDNPFWWLGNRPYRYSGWQGTNEEQFGFEDDFDLAIYSIHGPDEVAAMAKRFEEMQKSWKEIKSEELRDLLSDYEYCIEGVRKKNAGMLVENDT